MPRGRRAGSPPASAARPRSRGRTRSSPRRWWCPGAASRRAGPRSAAASSSREAARVAATLRTMPAARRRDLAVARAGQALPDLLVAVARERQVGVGVHEARAARPRLPRPGRRRRLRRDRRVERAVSRRSRRSARSAATSAASSSAASRAGRPGFGEPGRRAWRAGPRAGRRSVLIARAAPRSSRTRASRFGGRPPARTLVAAGGAADERDRRGRHAQDLPEQAREGDVGLRLRPAGP